MKVRPISLLNVDAKVFSTVLATRLQLVLPSLTKNVAYVPGRFIVENVLTLEANFRTDTKFKYLLLTDFQAAFDSVSHVWIKEVIKRLNLGSFFEKSIDFLLSEMKAYPIVGSSPCFSHPIHITAGVRQGDPVSGLIFNLVVEPLLKASALYSGLQLSYADDMAFLTKDTSQMHELIKLIRDFESSSGLALSVSKSVLVDIGGNSLSLPPLLKESPLSPLSLIWATPSTLKELNMTK